MDFLYGNLKIPLLVDFMAKKIFSKKNTVVVSYISKNDGWCLIKINQVCISYRAHHT
jgi:hypothetical protein